MADQNNRVHGTVYALVVYRCDDGSTHVGQALDGQEMELPVPGSFEARHGLLIAALDVVKREAGVSEPAEEHLELGPTRWSKEPCYAKGCSGCEVCLDRTMSELITTLIALS